MLQQSLVKELFCASKADQSNLYILKLNKWSIPLSEVLHVKINCRQSYGYLAPSKAVNVITGKTDIKNST